MIDKTTSDTIVLLRVILPLFVIFIHLRLPNEISTENFEYNRDFLAQVIFSVAVPCFFFISSYLFYNSLTHAWSWSSYRIKLLNRFKRLGLSYIGWNTLFLLLCMTGVYLSDNSIYSFVERFGWWRIYWDGNVVEGSVNILGWPLTQKYPLLIVLWYIRELLCMVILSPIFYWFAKNNKYVSLIVLTLLFLAALWSITPFFTPPAWYFWFLGAWVCVYKIPFVPRPRLGNTFSFLCISTASYLAWAEKSSPYYDNILYLYKISSVFTIIYMCGYIVKRMHMLPNWLVSLSNASFFVYCFHPFILQFVYRKLSHIYPLLFEPYISYVIYGGGVYFSCVLSFYATQKTYQFFKINAIL